MGSGGGDLSAGKAIGNYFPAAGTGHQRAAARLDGNGRLRLRDGDGGEIAAAPFASVEVSDRVGDVPRRLSLPNGAVFETRDNETIDAWQRRIRRGGVARVLHALERRWFVAVLALVFLVAAGFGFVRYAVPVMAERAAAATPQGALDRLGGGALDFLDRTTLDPSRLGPNQTARAEAAFARIRAVVPGADLKLVRRRMGATANAFALPDGTIVVTDELVTDLDDDELAAVLAHEAVHVVERHGVQQVLQASAVPLLIAFISGDIADVLNFAGATPALLLNQAYSRQKETQADLGAVDLLRAAGLPPSALAGALEKLSGQAAPQDGAALDWLSSHPDVRARVEAIRGRGGR